MAHDKLPTTTAEALHQDWIVESMIQLNVSEALTTPKHSPSAGLAAVSVAVWGIETSTTVSSVESPGSISLRVQA